MTWRDSLRPASFRSVPFKTEAGAKVGGRRGQTFEFPKRDDPSDEDIGRRAKRFSISGYLIGPDHNIQADLLERALDAEGPGQLVTMLSGTMRVRVETYTRTERRQEGGVTSFDMVFVEAGRAVASLVAESTRASATAAADAAEKATVSASKTAATSSSPAAQPSVPSI